MAYLVGGFFGFIGRALKKVVRVVGKVAGTALGVASVLVPGPAGRIIAGVSGKIAGVKSAYRRVSIPFANVRTMTGSHGAPPGLLNKLSAVMPGGSVAQFGNVSRSRKARPRKASRKAPKRSKGRKLKFGSPAWRKRYMKPRRRAA